jgi:hypothetical protein
MTKAGAVVRERVVVKKQGDCWGKETRPSLVTTALSFSNRPFLTTVLPFVIPSEAEGSAVSLNPKQMFRS